MEQKTKRLAHLDGLRGFAIALVVIFHVFVGKVSSGVDIFLYLGGILFLSTQFKNAYSEKSMTFLQSLLRLLRRLSPVLILVIAATLAAVLAYFPPSLKRDNIDSALAGVTYWENWHLIQTGSSYSSASQDVSPFQHLWSMSAQLQVYVVIMVIVYLFALYGRRTSPRETRARRITAGIILVLSIASFIYALNLYNTGEQAENYYSSFSRFWEMGIGAFIGLWLYKITFSPFLRWMAGMVGFALILCTGIFLDGAEQFPGPWTLIPIFGAFLLVAAGIARPDEDRSLARMGPILVLETKPFQFLGKIAYSLYLWHWPLMIVTLQVVDLKTSPPLLGVMIIVSSVVFAWATYNYVERYFQQGKKPRRANVLNPGYWWNAVTKRTHKWMPLFATLLACAFIFIVISPAVDDAAIAKEERIQADLVAKNAADYPGARVVFDGAVAPEGKPLYPSVSSKQTMVPPTTTDGCYLDFEGTELVFQGKNGKGCEYGDTSSKKTLYVVGSSHAEQYMSALDVLGRKYGIKIIPIVKMGCPLYQPDKWDNSPFPDCLEWSATVEEWIMDNPPTEGIFMTATRPSTMEGAGPEETPEHYVDVFTRFDEAGIPTFAVRDNPWFVKADGNRKDVRACIADGGDNESCGMSTALVGWGENPALSALEDVQKVRFLDFTAAIVQDDWVHPVMGNVLAYRDSHHLTRQFVDSMTDEIERQLFINKDRVAVKYPDDMMPLTTTDSTTTWDTYDPTYEPTYGTTWDDGYGSTWDGTNGWY